MFAISSIKVVDITTRGIIRETIRTIKKNELSNREVRLNYSLPTKHNGAGRSDYINTMENITSDQIKFHKFCFIDETFF